MPVEHVNAANFAAFVARPGVAIVHFWAEWDMCHLRVRREIECALVQVGVDVRHAMWNTDDQTSLDLVRGLAIAAVPTTLYFRHGDQVGLQVGNKPAAVIAHALARVSAGERIGRV